MEPGTLLIVLALAAAAAGCIGLAALWWYRRKTGFHATWSRSGGTVVASDTGAAPSLLLRDPALGLRGRPDYLLTENTSAGPGLVVPIELKPHRQSQRLYESDAIQLGAYLMLARATFGPNAAPFGYIRYANAEFRVELSDALERRVREVVAAIRSRRTAVVVHRSHTIPARCAGCPLRQYCDERLA